MPCGRARFLSREVSEVSVEVDIDKMKDRAWAVEQCSTRTAGDSSTQGALLEYGLSETEKWARMPHQASIQGEPSTSGGGGREQIGRAQSWWQCQRLLLLHYLDRLRTFQALHDG